MPVVLDGDYLLPEMGAWQEEVKSVYLYEPEEKQIIENFARREPDEGEQAGRARVSWLFGQWLKEECQKLGIAALPSRPWHTLEDRVKEAIS